VLENEGAAALAPPKTPRGPAFSLRLRLIASAWKGTATARLAAVGRANAGAIDAQVRAYGAPEYRLVEQIAIRLFEAVAQGH
jgi:hypothetical protein